MGNGLYVEAAMRGSLERLWELTQDPALHQRWDLRFSSITYLPRPDLSDPQRFTYATRIGFGVAIVGTGESVATREGPESVRTSSLRFWSASRLSLIEEGSGYWKYVPVAAPGATRFFTWYDYRTRFGAAGRAADLIFRPLIGWATAWSFDRLRFWADEDVPPELVRTCSVIYTLARLAVVFVWLWHGLVPKLLFHNSDEVTMLHNSGLTQSWLSVVGTAEVLIGLAGLLLWRWRTYLLLSAAAMMLATVAVAHSSPAYLQAAFNPVTLNLGVFTLSVIGWIAWRYTAFATRCLRKPPVPLAEAQR